ncbi:class I SAM-dependent methyltransferase [Kutzneria sp. CA-103260]|uniref:class I SAM-dependent methyltransferase n=1 Tax=Kutzneria sp. CA-103260 TaxID=2802641 RepID=UPI001BAC5781|nr:class I SAM-dependent methyltransferase [Kutzneria sp. CA-103260]QUQ69323.1 type 11 methyltransferase [Kutzneria sp. CA-103260]
MGELPFGPIAEQYDRFRPSPPEGLVDDLERLGGAVLDVGCGTGKAAVALAERGLTVLGVEPDERMASIARSHGVPVEIGAFETWDAGGRQFDLLTFADSWHFVDPAVAVRRAAELLPPGGKVARFWNTYVLEPAAIKALDPVYRRFAPEILPTWRQTAAWAPFRLDDDPFARTGFTPLRMRSYRSSALRSADEWVATIATTSGHLRLGDRLAPLMAEVHAAIDALGGALRVHRTTFLALTRRS